MQKLGLDYLDLYLIHQPYGDVYGAWKAMEELYGEGRVRAIGVANFYRGKFTEFAEIVDVKPMVNQIELHPFYAQRGVSIIPKSVHKERMEQNIDIWDFVLSDEDVKKIDELDLGHSEIIEHNEPKVVKYILLAKMDA